MHVVSNRQTGILESSGKKSGIAGVRGVLPDSNTHTYTRGTHGTLQYFLGNYRIFGNSRHAHAGRVAPRYEADRTIACGQLTVGCRLRHGMNSRV